MAKLNQSFNASAIKPHSFQPLTDGFYIAEIEHSDMRPTKKGDGLYLALTFRIVHHPDYAGRKLFENLNLEHPNTHTVEIAKRKLSAICRAVGITTLNDTEQLHDCSLRIKVGVKKGDQTKNVINAYRALDADELSNLNQVSVEE